MDEFIFSYTRKQAIEDGVLIDISELAKEAGFKVPVAITSTLYHTYVQDESGRLWDILFMLSLSAAKCIERHLFFKVFFQTSEDDVKCPLLKAVIGPGDTLEPVITIMLENED